MSFWGGLYLNLEISQLANIFQLDFFLLGFWRIVLTKLSLQLVSTLSKMATQSQKCVISPHDVSGLLCVLDITLRPIIKCALPYHAGTFNVPIL